MRFSYAQQQQRQRHRQEQLALVHTKEDISPGGAAVVGGVAGAVVGALMSKAGKGGSMTACFERSPKEECECMCNTGKPCKPLPCKHVKHSPKKKKIELPPIKFKKTCYRGLSVLSLSPPPISFSHFRHLLSLFLNTQIIKSFWKSWKRKRRSMRTIRPPFHSSCF